MIKRTTQGAGNAEVIFISDIDEVLRDLKKIDPEARKAFTQDTRLILQPYVKMVKDKFIPAESPLSNWKTTVPTYTSPGWIDDQEHRARDVAIRWRWDSGEARAGIKLTRGYQKDNPTRFDNVLGIMNDSVSGKMFELIGQGKKRNDSRYAARNPNAGQLMRDNMNVKHGNLKRGVWRIKEEYGAQITDKLEVILDPILKRFERG